MNQFELMKQMKQKESLESIQNYVESIMKEKKKFDQSEKEVFDLFEQVLNLAKSIHIKDTLAEEKEISSIYLVLVSLCNHLKIDLFVALKKYN